MSIEKQYLELLKEVIEKGHTKTDRTGTGTKSIFGRTLRHDWKDGFPLLTTKKVGLKNVLTELKWFLHGKSDLKYLLDRGCNIWVGDAYKRYYTYANSLEEPDYAVHHEDIENSRMRVYTQEEFVELIKMGGPFAMKWGNLGPIYGVQWRNWPSWHKIDQLQNVINDLKNNPDSRRMIVTALNPGVQGEQILPPCHYSFQVWTRELTFKERRDLAYEYAVKNSKIPLTIDAYGEKGIAKYHDTIDNTGWNIPKRAISMIVNLRSNDLPLGCPYNIASYAILQLLLCEMSNMVPEELTLNIGDAHIYLNQIELAKEQIQREPMTFPSVTLNYQTSFDKYNSIDGIDIESINVELNNYKHHQVINYPLSN